jgi:hypothetical protein
MVMDSSNEERLIRNNEIMRISYSLQAREKFRQSGFDFLAHSEANLRFKLGKKTDFRNKTKLGMAPNQQI